jgi:hypothetical protein
MRLAFESGAGGCAAHTVVDDYLLFVNKEAALLDELLTEEWLHSPRMPDQELRTLPRGTRVSM